jgi:hypothetical protein
MLSLSFFRFYDLFHGMEKGNRNAAHSPHEHVKASVKDNHVDHTAVLNRVAGLGFALGHCATIDWFFRSERAVAAAGIIRNKGSIQA